MGGEGQLLSLLLHVLYRHLDGRGNDLESDKDDKVVLVVRAQSKIWIKLLFITNL